ncbi:MAG: hypothetical protein HDR71_07265 [Lachnospiraceae bacterium]|nr:hypothetical protein [Lachnospiraceae bacterium]
MNQNAESWALARKQLVDTICNMGYTEEFGNAIAKGLGGERVMRRMTSYLNLAKPKSAEEIVDEMLAISSEVDTWRKKKANEYYNSEYNKLLSQGLTDEDEN